MSPFRNGNILSTPSRFIRKCEINLQNFNFCKHCYIRCHKNCVQDVHWCCILIHIFFWLNTGKNVDSYVIEPHVYQVPVLWLTRRIQHFHDLRLSYFYCIKAMSRITAVYLQWTMYVKTKSSVYICTKKTTTKLSRSSNPSLGKWKSKSFISELYLL